MNINKGPFKCPHCKEDKAFMRELRISKNFNITVKMKCNGCEVKFDPSIKDEVWNVMGYPIEPLKPCIKLMINRLKRHYEFVMDEAINFEF